MVSRSLDFRSRTAKFVALGAAGAITLGGVSLGLTTSGALAASEIGPGYVKEGARSFYLEPSTVAQGQTVTFGISGFAVGQKAIFSSAGLHLNDVQGNPAGAEVTSGAVVWTKYTTEPLTVTCETEPGEYPISRVLENVAIDKDEKPVGNPEGQVLTLTVKESEECAPKEDPAETEGTDTGHNSASTDTDAANAEKPTEGTNTGKTDNASEAADKPKPEGNEGEQPKETDSKPADNASDAKPAPSPSNTEADKPKEEKPASSADKPEKPKNDNPKAEAPKTDKPAADKPAGETPKDEPKNDAPKNDKPKAENPNADKPKSEKPKSSSTGTDKAANDKALVVSVKPESGNTQNVTGKDAGNDTIVLSGEKANINGANSVTVRVGAAPATDSTTVTKVTPAPSKAEASKGLAQTGAATGFVALIGGLAVAGGVTLISTRRFARC